MTRPRATTSPSDALGATIADLKARLARLENIAHQHRVLGSHLGLQEVVIFDTVGTHSFTKGDYPWLRAVRVRCQGGGGGGGGAGATSATQAAVGTGGGGGGYAESFITDLSTVSDPITVTVGGGGAGGVGDAQGNNGSPSSFGSLVIGNGGNLGARQTPTAAVGNAMYPSRSGGAGGTGDLVIPGSTGTPAAFRLGNSGAAVSTAASEGGSSHFGAGGQPSTFTGPANGGAGRLYGGGGSGASNSENESARTGGAGAQGIVIIDLFV